MASPLRFIGFATLVLSALASGACASESEDAEDDVVTVLPNVVRYPTSRLQSPITAAMVARWQDIAARAPGRKSDIFSKIGDSQTVNAAFMHCFSKSGVDYGDHTDRITTPSGTLDLPDTVKFFLRSDRGKMTFDRESLSAKVGARTSFALGGPLTTEVDATNARFALVLYGGNDIMDAPSGGITTYAKNMFKIVDTLLARGVIPIMSTNVPKPIRQADIASFGPKGADPWVPRYAAISRGIAQARQVPLIDLEKSLRTIPGFGVGSDDLHLYAVGGGCKFTDEGLKGGVNVRNMLSLDALHRTRIAFSNKQGLDTGATLSGSGTKANPYIVDDLTFTDFQSTLTSAEPSSFGSYRCGSVTKTGAGKERVYKLKVTDSRKIRAAVYSQGKADLDVYVLRERDKTCLGRSDKDVTLTYEPGNYLIVVDSESATNGGEYLLTLNEERD
ncbi:MAG: SGNH/GDSL hydrolase family protein [Polyangiaceae bacterium]